MVSTIESIRAFHCPTWQELPEEKLFNQELVAYIQTCLSPILWNDEILTPTMVQNYSKWGVIPRITGRKYGKEQMAALIIIAVLKHILPIDKVRMGIELQLRSVPIEEGFNLFSEAINSAIQNVFNSVNFSQPYQVKKLQIDTPTEGIQAVSYAVATKLLASLIIEAGGYHKIGESE